MPSFTRRATASHKPPPGGTVPSPSTCNPPLYLTSTGIPSLDDLLGTGGLPLGCVMCLSTPDEQTSWARLVERYWIAQGLVNGQKSLAIGDALDMKEVVKGCMWVDERYNTEDKEGGSESEGEGMDQDDGRTKIAWRYERMKKFQTTASSQGNAQELNLMTVIPGDIVEHLEKTGVQTYIDLNASSDAPETSTTSPAWTSMRAVLRSVQEILAKHDDKTVLRITVHELGGIEWNDPTQAEVHRFIHSLRGMIRSRSAVVLVTLSPSSLIPPSKGLESRSYEEWMTSLGWAVDALIELKGFGNDPTLPPMFHPLHGLLSIPTFPTTHHLLPPTLKNSSLLGISSNNEGGGGGAGENNLGFRLKRKRFVIETVHLGIEGGTGERRTEPVKDVSRVMDTVSTSARSAPAGSGIDQAEGVEKVISAVSAGKHGLPGAEDQMTINGVKARPAGADKDLQQGKKKPRARVRFGEDEVMEMTQPAPEVQVGQDHIPEVRADQSADHGHGHDHHHGHGHDHQHPPRQNQHPPAKATIRHDRMDLYEF